MKKWSSFAAIAILCLALVIGIACGGGEEEEEGVKKLKIGWGLPFTGAFGAVIGLPARYTGDMAIEKIGEFEVAGERYVWDIIWEENWGTIAGGTSSTMKFLYEHDVDFIAHATSDAGWAAASICEEAGIILIEVGGADVTMYTPDRPHCFQTSANFMQHYGTFFHWLTEEHPEVRRVVATHDETDMGMAMHNYLKGSCEYYGLALKSEIVPLGMVEYMTIASKLMTYDPDLVVGGTSLFNAMWDFGYEGLCVSSFWTTAAGAEIYWDKAVGHLLIFDPHPFGGIWPEVETFGAEFEDRRGMEWTPAAFWLYEILYVFTDVLQQAGTVDDADKIIETMEMGTFDSPIGPVYYGGEVLNGINHILVWPGPIYEVAGEYEYQVIKVYTPEEAEAIMNEIYVYGAK